MNESNVMFEEDIEIAVEQAIKTLGVMGRMDPKPSLVNHSVRAGRFGEIWYGDTNADDLQTLANVLQCEIVAYDYTRELGTKISVFYPND
jgi:hypothetical protein